MENSNNKTEFKTGHVGLNVINLETSKEFYKEVFGFEVLGESNDQEKLFAFLGKDNEIVVTLWQQSENSFDKQTSGLHHLSFEVKTIEEVQKAESFLKEIGAKFHHQGVVSHREGSQSGGIFFEDPDGIRLEIYSPTGANNNNAPSGEAPSCGFF